MLSGITFNQILRHFVKDDEDETSTNDDKKKEKKKEQQDENAALFQMTSATKQVAEVEEEEDVDDGYMEGYPNLYDKAVKKGGNNKKVGAAGTSRASSGNKKNKSANSSNNEKPEQLNLGTNIKGMAMMAIMLILLLFVVHCTWVTSNAYSSPSVVLASYNNDGSRNILDDFREAYHWLRQNTDDKAKVMSWWDYGYQIAGMANRTTLVDNNTWNNSHIALVGKAMASTEDKSIKIMRQLDVDYVLIIFGGLIGYSGDDINKFLWMVRIAEGEHPNDIRESKYFTQNGEFRVDAGGSETLLNSLMYKMCYYRFGKVQTDFRHPPGYDRTRNVEIGNKNIKFEHLEEAFTSEHWLVRIYRVNPPANRDRLPKKMSAKKYKPRYISKKTTKRRRGSIRDKPVTKKGLRSRKLSLRRRKKSSK